MNHLDNSVIADYQKEVLKRTIHNKNNSYYEMNNKKILILYLVRWYSLLEV